MASLGVLLVNGVLSLPSLLVSGLKTRTDVFYIGVDGGARHAKTIGVPLSLLVGDLDSLFPDEIAQYHAENVPVMRYPIEKDETDLELAFLQAVQRDLRSLWVFGALGGRIDHALTNLDLLSLPILDGREVIYYDGNSRISLLKAGEHQLNAQTGDTLSLLPFGGDAHGITTENLDYPLKDESLLLGKSRGMSNVFNAPTAHIRLRQGSLLAVVTSSES